ELVGVRLAEDAQSVRFAALDDRGVVHGHVALEDARPGGRGDASRPDHVLHRNREPVTAVVVADVEIAVQLGVARVDRGTVRGVGGTSGRSGSGTLPTAGVMSLSCPPSRSSSSSRSSSLASWATWSSCSREMAIAKILPETEEAPAGASSNSSPTGSLDRLDVR